MRQISAALKMITDMERIGDQADDIADIIMSSTGVRSKNSHTRNGDGNHENGNDSVDAYVKRDIALAQAVIDYDDVVDDASSALRKFD